MYLITTKYTSDAERKRIEYVLEKWRDRMKIFKPDGVIAIADGENIEELIEDLYSRTEKERNVSLYRIERLQLDIDEVKREISVKLNEKKETAEKLIAFIMARNKAVLRIPGPNENIYEVYTKKGKAEITINLRESDGGVNLRLRVSGYGEVVDFFYQRLAEELKVLGGKNEL